MSKTFAGHGLLINGIVFLSPKEALSFLEGDAILVDLREGIEKNGREFKVKTVLCLPYRQLENDFETLPRDKPLILADCVGLKSKDGVRFLQDRGYEWIASLNGGMVAWEEDKMPIFIDRDEELAGGCACRLRPRKVYKPRSGC